MASFAALLFIGSAFGQPLNIMVSGAQYATYVEAQGFITNYLPPISRTTISSFSVSNEIDVPYFKYSNTLTNRAIASADLFHVSDQTGFGKANAGATNQLWFSSLVDQDQTVGIQISVPVGQPFTAGSLSLLDLTSNSELWSYGWSVGTLGNVPWAPGSFNSTANFNVATGLLASHQYELTMWTFSNAADDSESVDVQLTGLQVVPEPSSARLLLVALIGYVTTRFLRKIGAHSRT